jgi:hypothetical protein
VAYPADSGLPAKAAGKLVRAARRCRRRAVRRIPR